MSATDVRVVVESALRTVQGTKHHLGLVTLEVLTDRVTKAVEQLVDAHRAEVLAADGQAYDGELTMLRSLVRTLRVVVRHDGDLREVWRLLVAHTHDDADARKKATPAGAPATPDFFAPGRTYQHSAWQFRCDTVTTQPDSGARVALGWFRFSDHEWGVFSATEPEWADGWTDITDQEATRG